MFAAIVERGPEFWCYEVVGARDAAVAAYYYLRVIIYMYMRDEDESGAVYAPSFAGGLALAIALIGVVLLGVMPAPFVELAQAAVSPLFR